MSDFIAESTIVVKANTKPFLEEIKRSAGIAERTKVQITVVADMRGFRDNLRQRVRSSADTVVARVRVRPDMTGFQAELRARVNSSASSVVATIPVNVGAVAAGAGQRAQATTGAATTRAVTAEQALKKAIDARVFAAEKIAGQMDIQEQRAIRLEREQAALTAAERAVTKAILEQNTALVAQAVELRNVAKADVERTTAQIARSAPGDPAADARAQAAEQKKANAELAKAEKERNRDLGIAHGEAIRRNREVSRLETQIANVRRQAANVDSAGANASTAVAGAQRQAAAAKRASAAATKLLEGATIEATAAQRAELAALVQTTAALEAQKVAALDTARAESLRATANKNVVRAIAAQTLQTIGLRGAALSANLSFLAAAAGVIAFTKALSQTAQFEQNLNVFRVTAGATADEMSRVGDEARKLGADITLPAVSAVSASAAMTELSKAGLSVQDSIDGARGVLQLATAASIDNAEATELAASALNAFGLAGDQAVHVADVLTNAANDAQGSIVDIGTALQQSAAVGRQAGLTLEQTVAVLTLFARNGLRGSDAGTSFRTALIRLINPTKKAQEIIKKLGLEIRTSEGAINLKVFDDFTRATQNMTQAQRDQALAIIFGQDAIRGAAILAREGSRAFDEQVTSLNKQGAAAELAGARMQGLAGKAENLKNQLSTLGLAFGKVITPGAGGVVDTLGGLVKGLNDVATGFDKATDAFLKFASNFGDDDFLPQIKIGPIDTGDIDRDVAAFFRAITASEKEAAPGLDGLIARLQETRDLINKNKENDQFIPPALLADSQALREELVALARQITSTGTATGLQKFVKAFSSASPQIKKAMQDGVITPLERAQLSSTALGQAFIAALPKRLFVGLAADVRSGIEDAVVAAKVGVEDLGAEVRSGIEDASRGAGLAASEMGKNIGEKLAAALADAQRRASNQLAGLRRAALDIEIEGGTDQDRLANLRQQEATARRRFTSQKARLARGDIAEESVNQARQELADIVGERRALEKQIQDDADAAVEKRKSEAEKARNERERKISEADQAFLDSLSLGRTRADRAVARAAATDRPDDDIPALLAMRRRLQAEIEQTRTGIKDVKTRTQELKRLSDELFNNGLAIQAARDRRDEAAVQAITDKGVGLVALGEATGNTKTIIRGLDLQIKAARLLVVAARAAKVGLAAAQAALAEFQKQRRDTINEARSSLLDQAFSLQEARGNKSGMLQIIELQIQQAKLEERQAKTLLDRLVAQTKIQELINKRKEILEDEVEKGQKEGTTAFDILQGAADTFRRTGGNIIGGNQPFAGPTGFTADLAQFLRRQTASTTTGRLSVFDDPRLERPRGLGRPGTTDTEQNNLTRQLITALQQLTNATLTASGNSTAGVAAPGTKYADVTGKRAQAMRRYYDSVEARKIRERRSGI